MTAEGAGGERADPLRGGVVKAFAKTVVAVLLVATACSTTEDTAGRTAADGSAPTAETVSTEGDPVVTFCGRWAGFAELMDSDAELSDELVQEVLDQQDSVQQVLPSELVLAWAAIVDWNFAYIEWFQLAGYQEVTEEAFVEVFGSEEEAAEAQAATEAGFEAIRSWADQNCAPTTANELEFCEAWAEITAWADAVDETPSAGAFDELDAAIDHAGVIPAEVRTEWAIWVDAFNQFRDVAATAGYDPARMTEELLIQAFGSVEAAEATEEAADMARADIDEWVLTGCGDFCGRWPEFRDALNETGEWLGWVRDDPQGGPVRLEERVRAFEVGTALVPDDIRDAWGHAVASRLEWIGWWESFEFDGGQMESPAAREQAIEIMRSSESLVVDPLPTDDDLGEERRRLILAWQEGATEAPEWLLTESVEFSESELAETVEWLEGRREAFDLHWLWEYWMRGPAQRGYYEVTFGLDEWVETNCVTGSGLPGTVRVRYPRVEGYAGDAFVVAVLPSGAGVEDLAAPAKALAGACQSVNSDPWGAWVDGEGNEDRQESEPFRNERWDEESLCGYRWEEGPVRLDAGAYTLVAAVMDAGLMHDDLGDSSVTPTPVACVALDFEIDGETIVDLPRLPPCDVDLGPATDDPWRDPPPVDPTTPGAGTLQVVVPSLVVPEEISLGEGGELLVIVLPGGTTLNEVGREQAWPAGAIHTWMTSPGRPETEEFERFGPVALPIADLPPGGSLRSLDPHWLGEKPPPEGLPLAMLAPGVYDVRAQVSVNSHDEERSLCSTFEVTIAGDTVVDLPELEECPSRF